MPTVQTYGYRKIATTSSAKTPLRTAAETNASTGVGVDQARAGKFGAIARVGEAGFGLAQVIGSEAIRQKAEATQFAHDVALVEADNKLAAWEHSKVYDPENGALTRKGKAAMGVPEELGDEYTKFAGEISAKLGTDRQRLDFEKVQSNRRQSMDMTLRRHVNQEMTAYAAHELDASVKLAQNDAIANALDPVRVGRSLDNAVATITKLGPSVGLGPDALKAEVGKIRTQTHVGVIESLLAQKQSKKAREYFEEVRDQVDGPAVPKLEAMITNARTAVAGLETSEAIWTALGPKSETDPINLDKMETEARTRYADDPETLHATISFLRERKSGVDASRKDREEANTGGLWTQVSQGASLAELTRSPAYLAAPGRLQAQLTDYVLNHAVAEANRRYAEEGRAYTREQRGEKEKEQAGWARYWELSEPGALAQMSDNQILAQRGTLGDDHVNRLMTQKRSLGKSAAAVHAATIDDDLFKTVAQTAGLDAYSPKTDEEKGALGNLRNQVETLIDYEQQRTGKALDRSGKEAIMRTVVDKKVMLDRWWPRSDEEKVASVVTPADKDVAYVPIAKIPAPAMTQAFNLVRSLGATQQRMTDQEITLRYGKRIEHAYALGLMAGRSPADVQAAVQEMIGVLKGGQ